MIDKQNKYKIRISPGVVNNDIYPITTTGGTTVFTYSSMTEILSGGTAGVSLLDDMSITIMLNQTIHDIGYYSEFDGLILQKDTISNFIYSANSADTLTYYVLNTSKIDKIKFLSDVTYYIDWGDGSTIQIFDNFLTPTSHIYPNSTGDTYTISVTATSSWGTTILQNDIYVPFTGITIDNPFGSVNFVGGTGNWAGIPTTYDYIFTGDSENLISQQISSNYTAIPFLVSGYTHSRVKDLEQYGPVKYKPGVSVTGSTGFVGQYIGPLATDPLVITYIIDGVIYYDYPDGITYYEVMSSGITSDMIWQLPIVKEEALMGVAMAPEVQSNVFVERGKNSMLETLQRLGEVDNIGDVRKYGYGFFNVKSEY